MLLNCAGPEAIEEYSHFVYSEGEEKENRMQMYARNLRNSAKEPEM